MKRLLFVCCALLLGVFAVAQKEKDLPPFGEVSREELEMKECEFEKQAPAMVLADEGRLSFKWNNQDFFRMSFEKRVRIKIFNTSGLDYGNVTIRYLNDKQYEYISKLEAYVYNLDGSGKVQPVKVSKDAIFDEPFTSGLRNIKFACPGVKPGSIIEYRYTVTRESYYAISPWVLQWEIPVKTSRYKMEIPSFFRFTLDNMTAYISNKKEEEKQEKFFTHTGATLDMPVIHTTYLSYNVPSLKKEVYMRCLNDYLERLEFDLTAIEFPDGTRYDFSNSWAKIAGGLDKSSLFGDQLKKKVTIPGLDSVLKPLTTPFDKMKAIHSYFTQKFTFTKQYDFLSENVRKIAENGKGTSGDINLLMINQLAAAGLEVYPILLSTRDNGSIKLLFPSPYQFNTVLAHVTINGRSYVLDGTDPYTYTGLVPAPVHNSIGMLLKPQFYSMTKVFTPWKQERQVVNFQGSLDVNGVVTGAVTIQSFDYAKTPRLKQLAEAPDKYDAAYLLPAINGITITRPAFKNNGNDTLPLQHTFICNFALEKAGDYLLMPMNLFTGLETDNPFLSDTRTSDVYFGYGREFVVNGRLTLPEGYELEGATSQPMELVAPDSSLYFVRDAFVEGNVLEFQAGIQLKKPSYPLNDYGFIKNFYKIFTRQLNEKMVIKKK